MILFLEIRNRYMFTNLYNPTVAEAEPHSADIGWRAVPGNQNPSQFCKTHKSSPTLLPHFAFLQSYKHVLLWYVLPCFLQKERM